MGALYLARDPVLHRDVAVGLVRDFGIDVDSDPELRARFEREARVAMRLRHPNLAAVYDVGEDQGQAFIATEYVEGETLADLIRRRASLPIERRLELIEDLCDGLGYAHSSGVVHWSLTPNDLAITPGGSLKILGLGLAAARSAAANVSSSGLLGNPAYMSPEQIRGGTIDQRSDIFSVGLVLYETLSYSRAYRGGSLPALAYGVMHTEPTPLSELVPDVDPALEAAVARAIQKAPERRYQTLQELGADLAAVRRRAHPESAPPGARLESEGAASAGSPPAAGPSRDSLRERRGTRIEAHLEAAQSHFQAGDYGQALEDSESVLILDPKNVRALDLVERAHRALAQQRIGRAVQDAREFIQKGEIEEVTRWADAMLAKDPLSDSAKAMRDVARAALEEQRAREAAERHGETSRIDQNVQFSVFRPAAITTTKWYPMIVFAHLASRRPDAPPGEPDPIDEVERRAKTLLGLPAAKPAIRVDSLVGIPEEGRLHVMPFVPGIEFEPPQHTFLWLQPIRQVEFSLRADPGMEGRTARGTLTVFLGAVIVADIALAIPVESTVDEREQPVGEVASPYRRLFASYSHKDEAIVRQFESYARGLGDRYVRDAIDLRAGEQWDSRLCELIDGADVFQLFWSTNSMDSSLVRREWEHALTVDKPQFIRPVYWQVPLPTGEGLPPISLARLHFAFVGNPAAAGGLPTDVRVDAILEQERKLALEREQARAAQEERTELARRAELERMESARRLREEEARRAEMERMEAAERARQEEAKRRDQQVAQERAEAAAEMRRREEVQLLLDAERERAARAAEEKRAERARRAEMARVEEEHRAREEEAQRLEQVARERAAAAERERARLAAQEDRERRIEKEREETDFLRDEVRQREAQQGLEPTTSTPAESSARPMWDTIRPLPESLPARRPRSLVHVLLGILGVLIVGWLIRGC
jgi:hypothetical protein